MPPTLQAGPYRTLKTAEAKGFPYYIIPFDADGACVGPKTRDHLISAAPAYTDIFVFSHGWNNDWAAATQRYEDFINGFSGLRTTLGLPVPADYRPLVAGIFWPSQALEWFDSETGPEIAAADPAAQDADATLMAATLQDIAQALPAGRRARFYELTQAVRLERDDAGELAGILAGLVRADDEGVRDGSPSADDLMAAAAAIDEPEPDFETVGTVGGRADGQLVAAGIGDAFRALDPRNLIKPFTVWQMKDRAGVVGARGVAPLLTALLNGSSARIHLLGHSYGCKVVMTAACKPAALSRPVESVLLLQPAVSFYAFASTVPERGVPGGFANAFSRVKRPIMSTFSSQDWALGKLFPLAVRRHDDVGELQAAAGPSLYSALGGVGPRDSGETVVAIQRPGDVYDLAGGARILGVNGTGTITGHGEISNAATWWMAYQGATAHLRYGN